ncbi:MAG TPA: pyruvate dehydrogenase (acetyl-transferring) E1 component subunit alpha [Dehalococcoidia bacterium]|nr:pyruvate dehydrogenase (acetyl-transferring) E1 component subunit alpha [Dehalococcoidia bacterium]
MAISERALAGVSKEELSHLLHQMVLIRRFEEKAAEMYARGRIRGFLHLYIGQEAVAVGAISLLKPEDYIVSHYREHGHALARGVEADRVMAELFGKATGVSKGIGGSMHLFDASRRFMGGYAIVGGHLPLACGLAMGCQYEKDGSIVCCFLGDGSVNEGAFHESLNLAAVWRLPVLFICENNFYAMGTAMRKVSALAEIYKRAEAYGIRSEQVDGMDVMAVRRSVDEALKLLRRGEGPVFIEAITYRFRGHSMADPEFYRNKEEVEHWRSLDPITNFRAALLAKGIITEAEAEEIANRVEREVRQSVDFAEQSPDPPLESLYANVYAGPDAPVDGWRGRRGRQSDA